MDRIRREERREVESQRRLDEMLARRERFEREAVIENIRREESRTRITAENARKREEEAAERRANPPGINGGFRRIFEEFRANNRAASD